MAKAKNDTNGTYHRLQSENSELRQRLESIEKRLNGDYSGSDMPPDFLFNTDYDYVPDTKLLFSYLKSHPEFIRYAYDRYAGQEKPYELFMQMASDRGPFFMKEMADLVDDDIAESEGFENHKVLDEMTSKLSTDDSFTHIDRIMGDIWEFPSILNDQKWTLFIEKISKMDEFTDQERRELSEKLRSFRQEGKWIIGLTGMEKPNDLLIYSVEDNLLDITRAKKLAEDMD